MRMIEASVEQYIKAKEKIESEIRRVFPDGFSVETDLGRTLFCGLSSRVHFLTEDAQVHILVKMFNEETEMEVFDRILDALSEVS